MRLIFKGIMGNSSAQFSRMKLEEEVGIEPNN